MSSSPLAQSGPDPAEFGWWLASRASGIVALLCVAVSVGIGLAMAGRIAARPRGAALMAVHRHTALAGLVAIAIHGITLLGDGFLRPSLGDIAVPFTSAHEPLWTGLGVTGGYLAALLGLSWWLRDRIGARRWRTLHRATILVYVLAVAHTLGAGTDAREPWMLALLLATGAPILFLFVLRVLTPPSAPAFRRFRVVARTPESADVLSLMLEPADGRPAPAFVAGQSVAVRADIPGHGTVQRTYSLSTPDRLRISVKREELGTMSRHLHDRLAVGDVVELGAPAGRFVLAPGDRPVVLLSAGIGATPVLAMLGALAEARSDREVWWVHCARDAAHHVFAGEAARHLARLPRGRSIIRLSSLDGRLTGAALLAAGVPAGAEFHLCGTPSFVADLTAGLRAGGVPAGRIRREAFGGAPEGAGKATPVAAAAAGSVAFARSDVAVAWDGEFESLLELAEAHAVPSGASCRVGSCHGCRATVLAGAVRHDPEPLSPPPPGSALLCCALPAGDVVLDA